MTTLVEDLKAARALIDTPAQWRYIGSWNACISAVGEGRAFVIYDRLESEVPRPGRHLRYYENDPATTHNDILALFDRAITAAERPAKEGKTP